MTSGLAGLPPLAIARIERRMRPGQFSVSGFLDADERLIDVIERDEQTLTRLALTARQIGDRLESIVQQAYRLQALRDRENPDDAMSSIGTAPLGVVDGRFEVRHEQTCGFQECPFEDASGQLCPYTHGTDFRIRCRSSGHTLRVSGFTIHLIRDHQFFEGNVPYRVDPADAAGFLELEPGQDYQPRWEEETIWKAKGGRLGPPPEDGSMPDDMKAVLETPEQALNMGSTARIAFSGDRCVAMVREPCALDIQEMCGALWVTPRLRPGIFRFARTTERFVPPSPSSEFLCQGLEPRPPPPNEHAPPAEATPNAAGWIRCPGCGIKIKAGSGSFQDGRHKTCGQRIILLERRPLRKLKRAVRQAWRAAKRIFGKALSGRE